MLLSGMMVFLGTIFAIIAFDTNMAVYNRITAQNAVDSAADAAALWQARGCNLLQQLNNLHYDVDTAACLGEEITAAACGVATVLMALEPVPFIGAAAAAARPAVCLAPLVGCDSLPAIDGAQQAFSFAVTNLQAVIADVVPFLAFANANACAKGSGADKLLDAVQGSVQGLLSNLGVNLPGFGDIAGAISGGLSFVPLYASPLDPSSLSLHVDLKKGEDEPWEFGSTVGEIGEGLGQIGCAAYGWSTAISAVEGLGWDHEWGWSDKYFFGNPGFMTWIAGKAKRDELLGLGKLKWLNDRERKKADEISEVMYTGAININDETGLEIPGFIAFASSQVEGDQVISHGKVDAKNKLITVHFSANNTGDKFWIFH
jgi:hypothetical protein